MKLTAIAGAMLLLISSARADPGVLPGQPQPITLNFQNTDIDMVLKFISDVTGRVFIKSDSVRGFVTVMAPGQVSADQAMKILQSVLEVKGFTLVQGPDQMVKVLSQSEAAQSELEVTYGNGSSSLSGEDRMVTQVIPLKFLSAQELKTEVASLISKNGNIFTDERTNALVITDLASNIRRVLKMIEALDVRTPQVLIEALIMEVSLTDETKFGIEWTHLKDFDTHDHTYSGSAKQVFDLPSLITEGLTYSVMRDDGRLTATLQMLATDKRVNILSTPHILTLNNQPALIRVGEEVPILTQTRNIQGGETIRSFDYKSVAIELEVTPRINQDREVFLKVHPLVKKILGFNAELNAPILANREAQTNILISDGQTVVIGGLMKDDRAISDSKIPILGDIPLLGNLFKQKAVTKEKTELLVFITPRVILSPEDAKRATIEKESKMKNVVTPNLTKAKEFYRLGKQNYRRKDYKAAVDAWQQAVDYSPNEKLKRKAQRALEKASRKAPSAPVQMPAPPIPQ